VVIEASEKGQKKNHCCPLGTMRASFGNLFLLYLPGVAQEESRQLFQRMKEMAS
jgi:hypothetical protein